MKSEARANGFSNNGGGGWFSLNAGGLMTFGVERCVRLGAKRREADAPRGIAAGILKLCDLLRQFRLAGARGGGVQHKDVVENAHQHLQPFGLAAPEFFDFQPERSLFTIVYFLHELGKLPDLLGHLVGNLLRADGGFFSLRLRVCPFVRGGVDLRGEFFEVLDFFCNRAERAGFNNFDNRAVIQDEGHRAKNCTKRDTRRGGDGFPPANRVRRLLDQKIRGHQQQRVAKEKRPLGDFPVL